MILTDVGSRGRDGAEVGDQVCSAINASAVRGPGDSYQMEIKKNSVTRLTR